MMNDIINARLAHQTSRDLSDIKSELAEIKATVNEIYKMIWSMKNEDVKKDSKEDTKKSVQKATK